MVGVKVPWTLTVCDLQRGFFTKCLAFHHHKVEFYDWCEGAADLEGVRSSKRIFIKFLAFHHHKVEFCDWCKGAADLEGVRSSKMIFY